MTSFKARLKAHPLARGLVTPYRMLRRALRSAHYGLFWPYYASRASRTWWHFSNREGRRLYQTNPPVLNPAQQRVLDDLARQGLALAHLDELFPETPWLALLGQYIETYLDDARLGRKKTFLKYLWGGDQKPILTLENPYIRLAAEERILAVVNSYLGMYAKLDFFSANVTVPGGLDAEAAGSQRWHRDPGDKKLCKVFLYVNDVDELTGPFTYALGSHVNGPWARLFPAGPRDGIYPPEGAVERILPEGDIQPCFGRAGTVIFCDTRGLHKGGYSIAKERIMSTFSYSSKHSPTHPIMYRYAENALAEIRELPPVARYALENEPR